VRVVLGEGAHAHDAVQRARGLVAVAGAELGHAQRQLAVGLMPWLKISTWQGQFLGFRASALCASSLSSTVAMNMFLR
jgi:hypothetical protein